MAIKIDHTRQTFSVTDITKPLTLDSVGGFQLKTYAPQAIAGTIAYDSASFRLKYHNGTKWIIMGSVAELAIKAKKQTPADYGTNNASGKYLFVQGSSSTWIDPVSDEFIRFPTNGSNVTIPSAITFRSTINFNNNISFAGNKVANISDGGLNDAITKGYTDRLAITYGNAISDDLIPKYTILINKYNALIQAIYNEPLPPVPTYPEPPVPPIVIPPDPPPPPPPVVIQPPPIELPPNPARLYNLTYPGGVTAEASTPYWALMTTMQSNLTSYNNTPRFPAVGSTFYIKYTAGVKISYKGGTAIVPTPYFVTYTYDGSIMNRTGGGPI